MASAGGDLAWIARDGPGVGASGSYTISAPPGPISVKLTEHARSADARQGHIDQRQHEGPAALLFVLCLTEPVERPLGGGFERTQIVLDHHPHATRIDSVVFVS
jgi:hypothetical protein